MVRARQHGRVARRARLCGQGGCGPAESRQTCTQAPPSCRGSRRGTCYSLLQIEARCGRGAVAARPRPCRGTVPALSRTRLPASAATGHCVSVGAWTPERQHTRGGWWRASTLTSLRRGGAGHAAFCAVSPPYDHVVHGVRTCARIAILAHHSSQVHTVHGTDAKLVRGALARRNRRLRTPSSLDRTVRLHAPATECTVCGIAGACLLLQFARAQSRRRARSRPYARKSRRAGSWPPGGCGCTCRCR